VNYPQQGYSPAQPQYPQFPQQPPAQQGYAPQPTAQQFTQPSYPPQGYPAPPQQYGQPQQPQQPLATGTIDDYYNQPSSGGGPSISWTSNGMPKPEGTTYAGIVARDVTNADIQQQTDPKTGAPKHYRDGRPQFVMKVPLKVQQSQEHPDGEAVLFVRGQMRDELVRAMAEAGTGGAPKGGDALQVTLVQRKPSRGGGNPMNVFAIHYTAANGGQAQQAQQQTPSADAPSPAPAPEAQHQGPAQGQYGQGGQFPPGQSPYGQVFAPVEQGPGPAPVQDQSQYGQGGQFPQPSAPAPQQAAPQGQPGQQAPQAPQGLSEEQQQLLARLTGGGQ